MKPLDFNEWREINMKPSAEITADIESHFCLDAEIEYDAICLEAYGVYVNEFYKEM